MIPSSKTFIHFGADFDSDFEEEISMRKSKTDPTHREGSTCSVGSTMDSLQFHTIPFDTLPRLKANAALTAQMPSISECHPSVCDAQRKRASIDEWKRVQTEKFGVKMSTIDHYRALGLNTVDMLGTLESLLNVRNDEYGRELSEPVYLKNTFVDFEDSLEHSFASRMRQRCLSDPEPAEEASIEEHSLLSEYGATLRTRAARLQEMFQSKSDCQYVQQDCPQKLNVERDTPKTQEKHSNALVKTEHDDLTHGENTMASLPSRKGASDYFNPVAFQAQFQPEPPSQGVTTLMVCNLPCKVSAERLTRVVNELGFGGLYNLIHVPRGWCNFMGYGFVNFIEPNAAARFSAIIGTYKFSGNSTKRAFCKVADNQGLNNNMNKIFRGSNYRRRAQVPVIR